MGRRKIIDDAQLLARARDVFTAEGITVGSRRLAREIGVSSSVLFQRFGSMEELFFASMAPPRLDLADLLTGGDPPDDPADPDGPKERIVRLALGALGFWREVVPVLTVLTTHSSFRYPEFAKRHPGSALESLIDAMMRIVEDQHRDGDIVCPDPGPLVLHLVATTYGLAMFERVGAHGGAFSQGTVRDLVEVLWHGLAPDGGRTEPAPAT